jgi:hypothetical protein
MMYKALVVGNIKENSVTLTCNIKRLVVNGIFVFTLLLSLVIKSCCKGTNGWKNTKGNGYQLTYMQIWVHGDFSVHKFECVELGGNEVL